MSETQPIEVKSITVRLEQVLTEEEAELIQKADRGELPCPRCASPLNAEKYATEIYTGVMLECLKCEFRELG
jgi:hypothetical protein